MEAAGGIDLEHGSHRLVKASCLGKIKFFGKLVDPKLGLKRAQPFTGRIFTTFCRVNPFGALYPRIMLRTIVAAATSKQRAKLKLLPGILEALTRIAPKYQIRQATSQVQRPCSKLRIKSHKTA